MSHEPLPLGVPDTYALRRRVLLTAALVVPTYLVTTFFISWLEVSQAWVVVDVALIYLLVARPLMKPVREAVKLRRRLAYDAWLAEKGRLQPDDDSAS